MVDIKAVLKEYDIHDDDFGFTGVSEEELVEPIVAEVEAATIDEYKARLLQVEKLIMPFLGKLLQTNETYIKWPPEIRKPIIEAQIEKILKITRR